jgi:hypothetical protein
MCPKAMLVREFREKVFKAVSTKSKKQHLLLFGKKMEKCLSPVGLPYQIGSDC